MKLLKLLPIMIILNASIAYADVAIKGSIVCKYEKDAIAMEQALKDNDSSKIISLFESGNSFILDKNHEIKFNSTYYLNIPARIVLYDDFWVDMPEPWKNPPRKHYCSHLLYFPRVAMNGSQKSLLSNKYNFSKSRYGNCGYKRTQRDAYGKFQIAAKKILYKTHTGLNAIKSLLYY